MFENFFKEPMLTADFTDLNKLMTPYRKEVKRVITQYNLRRIVGIIMFFCMLVFSVSASLLWLPIVISLLYLVLFFSKYFSVPSLTMNDAFYGELSKIKIENHEAYASLKNSLNQKGYLFMSEVEDFIEQEKQRRNINIKLEKDGANVLLGDKDKE